MKRFEGEIRFEDLEGGLWLLVTKDGRRLQISGGDDALRRNGQAVAVRGRIAEDAMGIGMTGPILEVDAWEPI